MPKDKKRPRRRPTFLEALRARPPEKVHKGETMNNFLVRIEKERQALVDDNPLLVVEGYIRLADEQGLTDEAATVYVMRALLRYGLPSKTSDQIRKLRHRVLKAKKRP